MNDIDIARKAELKKIGDIAKKIGIEYNATVIELDSLDFYCNESMRNNGLLDDEPWLVQFLNSHKDIKLSLDLATLDVPWECCTYHVETQYIASQWWYKYTYISAWASRCCSKDNRAI